MKPVLVKLVGLSVAAFAALGGLTAYQWFGDERAQIIAEQQRQIETLQRVAERLTAQRRVADLLVTEQTHDSDGRLVTTLLFVEYDRAGDAMPPRRFTLVGETVHVETQIIKFDRSFVADGDALRGQTIALFTRIYGSATAPDEGELVDRPGRAPAVYGGPDATVTSFERELWQNFWRLTEDADYAADKGVRVAHGETVWGIFRPDRLYTLELEAAGGLTLRSEPVRGIFREALSQREALHGTRQADGSSP